MVSTLEVQHLVTAQEAEKGRKLLDRVVTGLYHAGLSLQAASGQPAHTAREKISEALQHLDDAVHDIRDHVFRSGPPGSLA